MHESEKWKWSRSVVSPTLSDPMDCRLPGSSVHGIFQARVLEWGAIAFSLKSFSSSLMPMTYMGCYTKGLHGLLLRWAVQNCHPLVLLQFSPPRWLSVSLLALCTRPGDFLCMPPNIFSLLLYLTLAECRILDWMLFSLRILKVLLYSVLLGLL